MTSYMSVPSLLLSKNKIIQHKSMTGIINIMTSSVTDLIMIGKTGFEVRVFAMLNFVKL
jgi:hypothetical protein